jgi:hypothetical protein
VVPKLMFLYETGEISLLKKSLLSYRTVPIRLELRLCSLKKKKMSEREYLLLLN